MLYTKEEATSIHCLREEALRIVVQTWGIYLRLRQTSCRYIRRNRCRVHVVPVVASLIVKDSRYQPFKESSERLAKCIETDIHLLKTEMSSAFQSSKMTTDSISIESLVVILNDRNGENRARPFFNVRLVR
jgi:hypothetical protein